MKKNSRSQAMRQIWARTPSSGPEDSEVPTMKAKKPLAPNAFTRFRRQM